MTDKRILDVPLEDLRRRKSVKWQTYGPDVLPMWVAEMDSSVPPGVARAIEGALALGDFGYPAGNAYGEAFAAFALDRWNWSIDPGKQIRHVPDVITGIRLLFSVLTEPGDKILINPPVYPPFFKLVPDIGRSLQELPLKDDRIDLDGLEALFSGPDCPAGYLLCSPHNPTSTVHTREELERVAALARAHDVWVVTDEIHAPIAPDTHVPYAAIDPSGFVVTSASKSWNLAAVKCGLIVAGPGVVKRMNEVSTELAEGSASHLGDLAHTAALREDLPWLDQLRDEVSSNRELLVRLLQEQLPQVRYRPGDGTYLAWLDCRALGLDDPADFFLHRAKVAFVSGAKFGAAYRGFVRCNLATSQTIITEAVRRMADAVAGI